jgi:MoxR-like ATPase
VTDDAQLAQAHDTLHALRGAIASRIVGHEEVIDGVLGCLLTGGHVLLEGVPGLGKTQLVKTLASALELQFSRIQFTPDLMPADITGTQMMLQGDDGERHLRFQRGPVFTNLLLADEINRATPKTQSALLEAMEEKNVTAGREEHSIGDPFMVLATQNPIEMEGTYPLPEAQLDRFALKLNATYPNAEQLAQIVGFSTGNEQAPVEAVMSAAQLSDIRAQVRDIAVARHVQDFAIRVVLATHPDNETATAEVRRYVRHGASPRGLLAMILGAKARAFMDGRLNVSFDDLKSGAAAALRHRVLLNFEGEADGMDIDSLVTQIVEEIPVAQAAAT